jgi:hypothetical protein
METSTQTTPLIDYRLSAELLKEVASEEFRQKMEFKSISLSQPKIKSNNYIGNHQTHTLKVDKHIGIILADDPQVQFPTFNPNQKISNLNVQSPKPLGENFISQEKYESIAREFEVTPTYLLRLLGR